MNANKLEDKKRPMGVAIKESEWLEFAKIAKELGMNRHELSVWALRDFMRRYQAGEIQTRIQKTL
jgi:hypothetical protein